MQDGNTAQNGTQQAAQQHGTPDALAAARFGPVRLRNLLIKAATYEGRTDRHQTLWKPEVLPGLRRLTDAVHQ